MRQQGVCRCEAFEGITAEQKAEIRGALVMR